MVERNAVDPSSISEISSIIVKAPVNSGVTNVFNVTGFMKTKTVEKKRDQFAAVTSGMLRSRKLNMNYQLRLSKMISQILTKYSLKYKMIRLT